MPRLRGVSYTIKKLSKSSTKSYVSSCRRVYQSSSNIRNVCIVESRDGIGNRGDTRQCYAFKRNGEKINNYVTLERFVRAKINGSVLKPSGWLEGRGMGGYRSNDRNVGQPFCRAHPGYHSRGRCTRNLEDSGGGQ